MSDSDLNNLRAFILDAVKRHYQQTERPFWLASLGSAITRATDVRLPEGVGLARFIESQTSSELSLVRDEQNPKVVAVAEVSNHGRVADQIHSSSTCHRLPNARVPHSLRVAFCRELAPDERIYFRVRTPFKYVIAKEQPDPSFVEIEEKYRLSGVHVTKGVPLEDDEEQRLQSSIDRWIHANRLEGAFRGRRESRSRETALHRLVQAQRPELQKSLVIPADIALLLSQTE